MTSPFFLSPLGLAVASLMLAPSTWAQTLLETVVISGSRAETQLSQTPASIGSVSRKQWDKDAPKSVGEIINRIPGVFWNDLGNEQHSMGIRQPISTNSVYQYLEDGIPIRPLGVFNHNALNEINMNGAGGVEVVKGAASSLYGSNAVGGAVNFLTLQPSRTPSGYAGIRHDHTDGFTRVDSGASNTWGPLGLRFSHYSSRRDQHNWAQYRGGQKDSFTLRGDYDLGGSSWLKTSLVHTDLDTDTTGNLSEADFRSNPGKSINTFSWRKDKATRANVAWESETLPGGLTTATLFARTNDHGQLPSYTINSCRASGATANAVTCPTSVKGTLNNNRVNSLGLDLKHVQQLDGLNARLVSGVYIDRSTNSYVSDNLSVTRTGSVNTSYVVNSLTNPLGVRDYQTQIANDALFAQLELSPAKDWRVVAGGRYDSISYDFKNNLTPGANYGAANELRRFSRWSPKVGATWALAPATSAYVNFSQGFTPPEVSELYGKTATPQLKPAVYENREVGLRSDLGQGLKLDAALYELQGRDTIVSYALNENESENRNAGRTRSRGLEVALNQDKGAWDWRVGAHVADHDYLAYQVSPTLNYSGKTMKAAPNQTLHAQLGWKFMPASRLALGVVHLGSYWMDDANTTRYAGHTLLNLHASHQFQGQWELWGQVRNLTDKRYADTASRSGSSNSYGPGAPRSVMLGLSKSFGAR